MDLPRKKKTAKLFSVEYFKFRVAALTCIVVFCCVFVTVMRMPALIEYFRAGAAVTETLPAEEQRRKVKLTSTSCGNDLRIAVRDGSDNAVTGEQFRLTLTFPDGSTADFMTQTDGSCYIVELVPGEYSVSMGETEGYITPETVKCYVIAKEENLPVKNNETQAYADGGVWRRENGHIFFYGADGQKAVGLRNIGGKLYYFNPRGEKASSLGIDVSCFNGYINWKSVREQGIDFAIARVGGRGWLSGRVYQDSFLEEHLIGAKNAGLKTGVYFYSTAVNAAEAVHEAKTVIKRLKGAHLDLPVFIDMEFSGRYPHGRADRLPTAERVNILNAFCETLTDSGYSAGIYTGEYYMRSGMDYRFVSRYSYWLANYTENALPGFPGRYDVWQFTDRGRLRGISGTVDMDVIF